MDEFVFNLELMDCDIVRLGVLKCLLNEYCDKGLFAGKGSTPGLVKDFVADFDIDPKTPWNQRSTYSKAENDFLIKELIKMRAAGLIGKSYSPYASRLLVINKPDGSRKCCLDARELNKRAIRSLWPIPTTQECFDVLHGNAFRVYSGYSSMSILIQHNQESRCL